MKVYGTKLGILLAAHLVTLLIAATAVGIALASINTERNTARYDSCRLLRGLVVAAAPNAKVRKRATAYIDRTPLRNCHAYANRSTGLP